jgi:hypothetical protein
MNTTKIERIKSRIAELKGMNSELEKNPVQNARAIADNNDRIRNNELDLMVERGEAEYTYDNEGMISGVKTVSKKSDSNLFDSMYEGMG